MDVTTEVESWGELRKVPLATGRDFTGSILRDAQSSGGRAQADIDSEVKEVGAEDFVLLAGHIAAVSFVKRYTLGF